MNKYILLVYILLFMFKSSFNETINECSSLNYKNCNEYSLTEADGNKRCISKKDKSGCELKDCNELDSDRCYEYYYGAGLYQCQKTENGKACELKQCSDYTPENCGKFETNYGDTNCILYNGRCEEKNVRIFQQVSVKNSPQKI